VVNVLFIFFYKYEYFFHLFYKYVDCFDIFKVFNFILGRQDQNMFVFENRPNNKEVIAPERGKTGGDHAADALAANRKSWNMDH
jgi:hypothetical protein